MNQTSMLQEVIDNVLKYYNSGYSLDHAVKTAEREYEREHGISPREVIKG